MSDRSPRQPMPARQGPKSFTPSWLAGSQILGTDLSAIADAQTSYANQEWNDLGVVRYGYSGPTFLSLDSACGVKVSRGPLAQVTSQFDITTFPYYDVRTTDQHSDLAWDFVRSYVSNSTPVVALFPLLGHYAQDGVIVQNLAVYGASPGLKQSGIFDPNADGLILLARDNIAAGNQPAVLAHEMVHALSRVPHTPTPASFAWYPFLSVFSGIGEIDKRVWNGWIGENAAVSVRDYRPDLLTLIAVVNGSLYDQCTLSKTVGLQWLR